MYNIMFIQIIAIEIAFSLEGEVWCSVADL